MAADLFADRDLQEIGHSVRIADYPDEFANVVRHLKAKHPDVAVVYTGAIENYPDIVRAIEEHALLLGNSANNVQAARDPFGLQEAFLRRDIAFPKTQLETPVESECRWLRKCLHSAGGLRLRFANAHDRDSDTHYFQEFIHGQVCSGAYLGDGSRAELFGVSEMLVGTDWLGGEGFKYCGSLTRGCSEGELDRWRAIGDMVTQEFGLVGVFGVDAVLRGDVVVPLEVNPRYTASMELFETDSFSVIQQHVVACQQQRLFSSPSRPRGLRGKCILYANSVTEFPEDFSHVRYPSVVIADIPQAQVIEAGHPILTMLAESNSRAKLIEVLKAAATHIRAQLATA